MAKFSFDWTSEGFSNFTFVGDVGQPPGCMRYTGHFNYAESYKTGLSIPVEPGDHLSLRCRVVRDPNYDYFNMYSVGLVADGLGECLKVGSDITFTDNDSGWFLVSGSIHTAGTVTALWVNFGANNGGEPPFMLAAYFDSIYVAESPLPDITFNLTHSRGGIPGKILEV